MPRKGTKASDFLAQGIRFTEEFTTMQLIIGVSVLMLFGLICFLAGILVGKMDGSLRGEELATVTTATKEEAVSSESAPTPKPAPEKPKPVPSASNTPKPAPPSGGPRVTDLPPPPAGDAAPQPKPTLPPVAPAPKPEPMPVPASAPKPEPIAEPAKPDETRILEPIAPPADMEATPAPASTPRGNFGIQVASFSGETRNQDAVTYQRRLKETTGLESEILAGEGGFSRVIIVGYTTREAANNALASVKQKPGLSDAFVRALP